MAVPVFPAVAPDSPDERQHRIQLANGVRALQGFARARLISVGQTITLGGLLTIAHGLGDVPFDIILDLQCVAVGGEGGWARNDIAQDVSGAAGATYSDVQNVYVRIVSAGISIPRKDTGVAFTLTPANWNLIVKAFR